MSMKKILVALMSMTLLFTTIPVSAAEDDGIQITCNKLTDQDEPYTSTDEDGNEITVYTLSALARYYDQTLYLPNPRCFTLTTETGDLSHITAEMDTSTDNGLGKKDIKLTIKSRAKNKAEIEANFSSKTVKTGLNFNARILVKGADGTILKKIPLAYSTPALTDEHDAPRFHTLSPWSGTSKYNYDLEDYYKVSGTVDVYAKNPKVSYTYKALGTYGLKNFLLNMDNDKTKTNNSFTFTNGKITIGAKNGNPGQKNTVTLVCKSSYLKSLKTQLAKAYCQKKISTADVIFDDLSVEYRNVNGKTYENGIGDNGQGCVIGGAMDPIYLGFHATVKPAGKVKITSYKKTKTTIKLRWKKLSTPVSGYMIYRSTRKSSGYKKIKTVSSKTSSYTNKRLKRGKTYYYKIRPYRTEKYSYKTSKKKTKTLSRKAYGSYGYVKKIKTKR